ncbi:MAG: type II toxin-antitoxin system prevent-host-death family antitoxin [Chloroflexota bacterium]
MPKTTTVTELRADLAGHLRQLREGPLLVLSHSRPAAVLVEPEVFDAMIERLELLEDLLEGRRAVAQYLEDPGTAVEAEEVFGRLGL